MHHATISMGGGRRARVLSRASAWLLVLAWFVLCALALPSAAGARDGVVLRGLEATKTADGVRIALIVSRAVSFDARVLAAPLRLEMVVPRARVAGKPRLRGRTGLVRSLRVRRVKGGTLFIFRLSGPALIAEAHAERAGSVTPARLVVTLQRTDAATLAAMLGVPESRLRLAREEKDRRSVRPRPRAAAGTGEGAAGADAVKAAFRRLVEQAAAMPSSIDDLIRAAPVTFGPGHKQERGRSAAEEKGGRSAVPGSRVTKAGRGKSGGRAPEATVSSGTAPVIVVDAGHGGKDPGAMDDKGRKEKDIVLKFAHALRRALAARGYRVIMTRTGDTFLKLRERSAVARRHHAALFVSIHADKFRRRGVGGLGIYTLSEKASDEDAAELARMENAADLIGAPDERLEDDAVRDILVELTQRETNANSHLLATRLVRALKGVVRLRRNPVRSAAFRVLRSPEIPSLLIELGYITNPRDVRDMLSPAWRKRAAARMAETIDRFLQTRLARN